jgi:hypothetical protein
MMDDETIRTMKLMAWERAKGELRSMVMAQGMLQTVAPTSETAEASSERWKDLDERIEAFIVSVEDDGLHE